jgi:hypothetical protein
MCRKVWSASLYSSHLYNTLIHSAYRQSGIVRKEDKQRPEKVVKARKQSDLPWSLWGTLGYRVLNRRGHHKSLKEKRKMFMQRHAVRHIVTDVSGNPAACIFNVERNACSMKPTTSSMLENLFSTTIKKFFLLYPEDGSIKFLRKALTLTAVS